MIKNDIVDYRFVVPNCAASKKYFDEHFHDKWQSSDGGPFNTKIIEGYLLSKDDFRKINTKDIDVPLTCDVYEINDKFIDDDTFITAFWDGDVEDDDFIKIN